MAKYLVACACGRQHTVETRQAGESFVCDCGTTVAVPTLRQLRQLPEAREEIAAATGTTWGARQGAMTVSLLLAAVCLAICRTESFFRTVRCRRSIRWRTRRTSNRLVTNMTPLQAWERWIDTYQPLTTTGFKVYKHPATDAMQMNLDWHRWIQWSALGLAAVFGVTAVVLGVAGGRQSKA